MKYIPLITIALISFFRCSFSDNIKEVNKVINDVSEKHKTKITGEFKSSNNSKNEDESSFSSIAITVYSDSTYLGFYNNILFEVIDGLHKKGKHFSEYQVNDGNGDPILQLSDESHESLRKCRSIADKAHNYMAQEEYQQLTDVIDRKHIEIPDSTLISILKKNPISDQMKYVGFVPIDVTMANDTIRLVNFSYRDLNLDRSLTITIDPKSVLVAGID